MKTFESWWNFKKKEKPEIINEPENSIIDHSDIDPYGEEDWVDVDEKFNFVKQHLFKRDINNKERFDSFNPWYKRICDIILITEGNNHYLIGDIMYNTGFRTYYYYPRGTKKIISDDENLQPLTDAEYEQFVNDYLYAIHFTGNLRIDVHAEKTYFDILYNFIKTN